jgi:nucleoside phosphorylase
METIGLMAAMRQESRALLSRISTWKHISIGPYQGFQFHFGNRRCVLITFGMGFKRARAATRIMINEVHPHLLISFGIAGATNLNLQIGDVVIASSASSLENGQVGQSHILSTLSDSAFTAASQATENSGGHLVIGTTITTRGAQLSLQDNEKLPHPVLEMETAGIAEISEELGIPLVSIRSISDGPRSPIPIDLEGALNDNYDLRIGKLFQMVIRHPKILFLSRQIILNSRIAADHAAIVVTTVLNQPFPISNPLQIFK